jgi:hypothetical protein
MKRPCKICGADIEIDESDKWFHAKFINTNICQTCAQREFGLELDEANDEVNIVKPHPEIDN